MAERKKKSKKRSATKSWRPDPSVVYFLDENLGGSTIATALRAAGASVEVHKDHFSPGTPDVEWLAYVTKKGWITITRDQRIRFRPNEVQTIVALGARVLVVVGGSLTGADLAELLVRKLKAIESFHRSSSGPSVTALARTGRLSRIAVAKRS